MKKDTSWGKFAQWYQESLQKEGSYQREVILPNLSRVLEIKKGEIVLDLACGEGFFSREFAKQGAGVIAVDISRELINLAKKHSPKTIEFHVSSADNLAFLKSGSVDKVAIVLAIQNIENYNGVLKECFRVLKKGGSLAMVLSHPAFRVLKYSSWGFDSDIEFAKAAKGTQYRRIDRYLSEAKVKIQMHPGEKPGEYTVSFHRPLQFYVKGLRNNGFLARTMEEWISHKKSEPGPRSEAENIARREMPLFLLIEAVKLE